MWETSSFVSIRPIRAGICSCFFLQIIGAPPTLMLTFQFYKEPSSTKQGVFLSLLCTESHLSSVGFPHACEPPMLSFSKTSFDLCLPSRHHTVCFPCCHSKVPYSDLYLQSVCFFTSQSPHLNINTLSFYHSNQVGFAKVNSNLQTDSLNA